MELFTLEQAEALLPQVREELLAMQALKAEIDGLRGELGAVVGRSSGNGHVRDEAAVEAKRRRAEALVDDLNGRLARLNAWGVELKGLDEGLVDFPSERDGRVVYLCWRLGEERIAWWHEIDAGFAGRRPL
ncbi:MAG TPA: DUF2203 domain-containing protein [Dehalococcoidia bacterium]|nr:DUF2203 domain-containing protein [Dehalococcoidia bacterium]